MSGTKPAGGAVIRRPARDRVGGQAPVGRA